MRDLLQKYAGLKNSEATREERLREEKQIYQTRVAMINKEYEDLDKSLQSVRDDIQAEVSAIGGFWEDDSGKIEIQSRPSWEIFAPGDLVGWLTGREKTNLWEYNFKKAEINKICVGLDIAGFELPYGIKKELKHTLVITLPKYDSEPETV